MKAFLATLPEERREELMKTGTSVDVAREAGADKRIGYLAAAFYHIHSIQSLVQAEIEIMLDNWNLWMKGLRPAMTSVQQADDKFFRAMRESFSLADVTDEYCHDVDSLHRKFFRWEGIPTTWNPGEPQRTNLIKAGEETTDETLVVEDKYEICRIGTIDTPSKGQTPFGLREVYCVGEMEGDESVKMGERMYRTIAAARTAASNFAKANNGKTYLIYKRTDYWHYRPMDYKRIEEEEETA